jgi:hypothetical protein
MSEHPGAHNKRHAYRHAIHAYEDFKEMKLEGDLAHSLSHHLRHVVYRIGLEVREDRDAKVR